MTDGAAGSAKVIVLREARSVIGRIEKRTGRRCNASSLLFQTVELRSECALLRASSEGGEDLGAQLSDLIEDGLKEKVENREVGRRFTTVVLLQDADADAVTLRDSPPSPPAVLHTAQRRS